MFQIDIQAIKQYLREKGFKQKVIAERAGITEAKLSLILQEKRKLEAGEYAGLCNALNLPLDTFVKSNPPEIK